MNNVDCNAITKDGGHCRFKARACPHHQGTKPQHNAAGKPVPPSNDEPTPSSASERVREAVLAAAETRDVHAYTWTVAPAVITGEIPRELAAVAVSACRALIALPERDTDRETTLRDAAMVGGVLHGLPPRDEAAWELARDLFDEPTLEQLAAEKPLDGWFTTIGGGRERRP